MNKMRTVLSFFTLITLSQALQLPPFIKKCKLSAPDVDDCLLKHAREAVPGLVKGVPQMRLPSFSPLILPQMTLTNERDFSLKLNNITVSGLDTAQVNKAKYNPDDFSLEFTISFDNIKVTSFYEVDGKILLFKIEGTGDAAIMLEKPVSDLYIKFEKYNNKGEVYIRTTKSIMNMREERAIINLTNLFNGNKQLGDQMNKFLNENQKDVMNDLRPSLQEAVNVVVKNIVKSFGKVKYSDIFL